MQWSTWAGDGIANKAVGISHHKFLIDERICQCLLYISLSSNGETFSIIVKHIIVCNYVMT